MEISFHGAAGGTVTGSCHLVQVAGKRILIDCGLFQGGRALAEENANDFGFDPRAIDFLLLTHAHLDHCGRIPLLVKRGFRGEIITTAATRDLAKLVLIDSAGLQVEDAKHHARHLRPGQPAPEPLYDVPDVLDAMEQFGRAAWYLQPIEVCPGVRATFGNAAHILGSAWILLELEEGGTKRRVVFSGDLGDREKPLLLPLSQAPACDVVVMESTYGDRDHKPLGPSVEELKHVLQKTLARGGNVVIPTFALERAQDLLYYMREMVDAGDVPNHMPVYLDSPMAISATGVFRRHPESFRSEIREMLDHGRDPFLLPGLRFTRDTAESRAINDVHGGAVIMAGSGMATGGRILHHLQRNLPNRQSSIVFVGYAADGTVARRIIDGARHVHLFGEDVPVAAEIHTIGGFSAHADHTGLLAWHAGSGQPACTFLVHGEEGSASVLAADLAQRGLRAVQPAMHQSYRLEGEIAAVGGA